MASYGRSLQAAALSPVNLVGFLGLGLVSLISMNPLPFLIALAGEAAWLGVAPLVPAFRRSVDRRDESLASAEKKDAAVRSLDALPAPARARYHALEAMAADIRAGYEKIGGNSRILLDQISGQLDALLPRYLAMLSAATVFDESLRSADVPVLEQRLAALDAEIAASDERVAEIKRRQRSILERRIATITRAREDGDVLRAQLDTFEDLVRLLKEQMLTMRDPAEASAQIESLVSGIEVTENTVRELEQSYGTLFDRELAAAEREKLTGGGA